MTGDQVGLTVIGGALLLDGADSLRIGNTRLTATGLASVLSDADITIGAFGDSGFALFPTGIKFSDGTIMTTAMMQGPAGSPGATGVPGPTGPAGAPGAPYAVSTPAPSSTLDLTKQAFVFTSGSWTLPDGVEGQVIYFSMHTGSNADTVYITISHLRDLNNGLAHVHTSAVWTPFSTQGGNHVPAVTFALFTQGAWSVSAGEIR